jgi:toxin-antitoxin system PIN domain toxin
LNDSACLFDTNVWIALAFATHSLRSQAMKAYASVTDRRPAVFCRSTQQSFLRLATTAALLQKYGAVGFTNADALEALHQFLALPTVSYREEPPGLVPLWHHLAARRTAAPKVWMDAYLAAFAIAGDLSLVTFDRDFKPFVKEGLKLQLLESS